MLWRRRNLFGNRTGLTALTSVGEEPIGIGHWTAEESRFDSLAGARNVCPLQSFQTGSGAQLASYPVGTGSMFLGGRA
jgi:hypothetical protein